MQRVVKEVGIVVGAGRWKSENLNVYFIFILENLFLKIVFGNNTIFLQQFYLVGGGGNFPLPLARPLMQIQNK